MSASQGIEATSSTPESILPPVPDRTQSDRPLVVALFVFLLVLVWVYFLCLKNTAGQFVYPLDDTYIHLAMAQNLAEYGIWGVNAEDGFASAASSLAWPIQLAGLMLICGPQEWLPLVLNLFYGVLALAAAYWVLIDAGASRRLTFWVLVLTILGTSLPVLVLLGMEHTMQAAFGLLFAWAAARILTAVQVTWRQSAALAALAFLVTATRYEGVFEVLAVALAALLMRRWRDLLLVPIAGAVPIAVFGLYSVVQGSLWLPNPIAMKSDFYGIHSLHDFLSLLIDHKLPVFLGTPAVYVPLLLALLGVTLDAASRNRLRAPDRLFVLIVALTAGMHLFGARTGWFTRYEAYLVFMALIAAGVAWRTLLPQANLKFDTSDNARAALVGVGLLLLALVAFAPLLSRMNDGLFSLPAASKNIHDQQIQMARFIEKYYDGEPILINDLGAIAFYTKARPVDMAGLATLEVVKESIQRPKTVTFLDDLARTKGAKIAIIYTSWLPAARGQTPAPPSNWIKVGSWQIRNNVICGSETVDFYVLSSTDSATVDALAANLKAFSPHLPADVKQSGMYTH